MPTVKPSKAGPFKQLWLSDLVLLPAFFTLHHAASDYLVVSGTDVLLMILAYSILGVLLYLLLSILWGQRTVALFHTLGLMTVYLFWGYWYDYAIKLLGNHFITKIPVLFTLLVLTISGLAYTLNKQAPNQQKKIMNGVWMLLLIYTGYDGYKWLYNEWKGTNDVVQTDLTRDIKEAFKQRQKPTKDFHVYILLFDALASTEALQSQFQFSNQALDSALMSKGFWVNTNSKSNYPATVLSTAAFFNAHYLPITQDSPYNDKATQVRTQYFIQDNPVVALFAQAQYTINNLSIFKFKGFKAPLNVLFVLPVSLKLLNYNTLYGRIEWYLTRNFQNNDVIKHARQYNADVQRLLPEITRQQAGPQFTYAHFMMPHFPYNYNAQGQLLPLEKARAVSDADSTQYYLYQIPIVRHTMLTMVDSILKYQAQNAIILCMSDHGYRSHQASKKAARSPSGVDWRFYNFSAVYYPDQAYANLYTGITNVNLSRALLNKALGTRLPYLPDSLDTYFINATSVEH